MKDFENLARRVLPSVIVAAVIFFVCSAAYDAVSRQPLTPSQLALYVTALLLFIAMGARAWLVERRKAAKQAQAAAATEPRVQAHDAKGLAERAAQAQHAIGQPPTPRAGTSIRISSVSMPWVVLVLLVLFVIASIAGIAGNLGTVGTQPPPALDTPQLLPFAILIVLALAFGIWFIICFTGTADDTAKDRERRRKQSFRFAYVFTLTSLVVPIFPVTNPWQPDLPGPVSLIRGCVDAQRDNTVPMSIRCGNTDLVDVKHNEALTNSAASGATSAGAPSPTTQAAPGSGSPAGGKGAAPPAAAQNAASDAAVAASELAAAEREASAAGGAGFSLRIRKRDGFIYEPTYPWLVVIGGTYATAGQPLPASGASATSADGKPNSKGLVEAPSNRKPYQVIEGGFVVPYYVVLLALLGGAIALTRKIPEYQKRSEPEYVPTPEEPPLDDRTVREQVVFQIMQLITAPFVAMVAFYSLAPSTVASGIALGFISGFSSELVLLQIRGLVEALHPKSSPNVAQTSVRTGTVKGTVHFGDDPNKPTPVPNATVTVKGTDPELTTQTDTAGGFAFAKVPIGPQVLTASEPSPGEATGTQAITVGAATETTTDIVIKKTSGNLPAGSAVRAQG